MLVFLENIGGSEVVVILLFILIFFGSKNIPGIARTFGRFMRQVRDASQDIQDEIKKSSTEIQREININKALHEANIGVNNQTTGLAQEIEKIEKAVKSNVNPITDSIEESMKDQPNQNP
ncbi:MAG: twin-arginine translocase TatA/TatE family subunit [Brumimicrobium sp.]|nr:twin-arginine translocase TatA/TatE family subunit [Brumimicrobium sp.]MCO5268547.1 twin-arginine translocase TatA/TatE family subunit [Brumimicrobium sp.]